MFSSRARFVTKRGSFPRSSRSISAQKSSHSLTLPTGFHRLSLECRGHGQSDAGQSYSIASFADDVAAVIENIGTPVILGGISMGAAIATRIAVTKPHLVSALALIRPAWIAAAAPANLAPCAEVGRLIAAHQPAGTFATPTSPDNHASLTSFFARPQPSTAALLTQIAADGPGIAESDIAALKMPTVVMGCAEDFIHPLRLAHRLASLIPGAGFVDLPPKGRDKPAHIAALHAALTQFLKDACHAPSRHELA